MTTSSTNAQMTYAKSRSRLRLYQCLRLAMKQLGVGGVALGLPILIVFSPLLAHVEKSIEVGGGINWSLAIASVIAGTMVCVACFRRAAIRICTERTLSTAETGRFMRSHWRSSLVVSLLMVLTTTAPIAASSLLSPSVADFVTGIGYFVGAAWFLLWPLIVSALAVESCDAADAISRAVHFVLSRPIAAILSLMTANAGVGLMVAAGWAVDALVPTRLPLIFAVIQAAGLFVVSNVLAYLLLREQVDAVEWDEIATEQGDRQAVPLSGRAESDRRAAELSEAA